MYLTFKIIAACLFLLSLSHMGQAQSKTNFAYDFMTTKAIGMTTTDRAEFFDTIIDFGDYEVYQSSFPPSFVALGEINGVLEILGYSTSNLFQENDSLSPGTKGLIGAGIRGIQRNKKKNLSTDHFPIQPMLTTRWGQGKYFNQRCPADLSAPNGHASVGCVAVAMGQIVAYYGRFNHFELKESYRSRKYGDLSVEANSYPWQAFLDEPLEVDLEVCQFLSDLGIAVHTNYDVQSSSASTGRALKIFEELGYDQAYRIYRDDYSHQEWMDILLENVQNYQPVFVAGGGHAFVLDGMDENGFLHFNLGGAGLGDGYYASAAAYGYTVQEAIVNLLPSANGPRPRQLILKNTPSTPPQLNWKAPEGRIFAEYNIYLDDELIGTTQDTFFVSSNLDPGAHRFQVSCVADGKEGSWIGPVLHYVPGEEILISDQALAIGIQEELRGETDYLPFQIEQGQLAMLKRLSLKEPLTQPEILKEFKDLQILHINGQGMGEPWWDLLQEYENIQYLALESSMLSSLPDLTQNSKLLKLELVNCHIDKNLKDLGISGLRALYFNSTEFNNQVFGNIGEHLELLEIVQTPIQDVDFLSHLGKLKRLKISDSNMKEFSPNMAFSQLQYLDLSGNALSDTDFLRFFPSLLVLNVERNNIATLGLHSKMDELIQILAKNNKISQVRLSFGFPKLIDVDLSHNKMTTISPGLLHAPGLWRLNVGHNEIFQLPKIASPALEQLILAYNGLVFLPEFMNFKNLTHLDLTGNAVSDINPILQSDFYKQLKVLNLTGMPLSEESFADVLPKLKSSIGRLEVPDRYQPSAPCYLMPADHTQLHETLVEFSWIIEDSQEEHQYELLLGRGDSMEIAFQGLTENRIEARLKKGEIYHWQVKHVLPDTTYYSGRREIRTIEEIGLPFEESFEEYPAGASLTIHSNYWRLSNPSGETLRDAQVMPKEDGGSKNLVVTPTSDLKLDLDHLKPKILYLDFTIWVEIGKSAHVGFINLDGLQLDVYLHPDGGEVVQNGILASVFDYKQEDWVHFSLAILAKNDRIFLRKDGALIHNQRWFFRNHEVHIDGINIGPDKAKYSQLGASYSFKLDDLHFYENRSSGLDQVSDPSVFEVSVYPNPASNEITISGLGAAYQGTSIHIIDLNGVVVKSIMAPLGQSIVTIPVQDLVRGMYILSVQYTDRSPFRQKILLTAGL